MQQVHLSCCNACSVIDAQVFTTQLHCSSGAAKLNRMQGALISRIFRATIESQGMIRHPLTGSHWS